MIIGLTGQIGSGKTTAAEIFADLGATVVDADQIGREVVEQSPALRKRLVRAFGEDVADSEGNIIRKRLAALAFRNASATNELNQIVHPYLLKELWRQVRAAGRKQLVVIDAALLLHWDMDREVDLVVFVHTGLKIRLERLKSRGITKDDAVARNGAQVRYTEFQARSDRLIRNNRTPAFLRKHVVALYEELVGQID
jgi:dephospho-CoA kinase